MRQFVNKYGKWIIVAAVLVIIPLAWYSSKRPRPQVPTSGDPSLAFYVDEETGVESIGPADAIPPLMGQNGKRTLVQACKLDFGGTVGVKTVYFMKYSPDALEQMDHRPPTDPLYDSAKLTGRVVRRPAPGSPWVPENSPAGQQIVNNTTPGPAPEPVYPKR